MAGGLAGIGGIQGKKETMQDLSEARAQAQARTMVVFSILFLNVLKTMEYTTLILWPAIIGLKFGKHY